MSLTKRFVRNLIGGYAAIAVAMVVKFAFISFFINRLGTDRYGLWVLAFAFGQFTSLLDLGFIGAIRRFQSQAMAKEDTEQVNEVLGVSLRIYGSLGVLAFLVSISGIFWLPLLVDVPPELRSEFVPLMIGVGAFLLMGFVRAAFTGVIFGANRLDLDKMITTSQQVMYSALAVVLILLWRADLVSTALAIALAGCVCVAATYLMAKRVFPAMRVGLGRKHSPVLGPMARFASLSMTLAFAAIILQQAPKFVVGHFMNVREVAYLAIPMMLVAQLSLVVRTMALPMFPMAARLEGKALADLYVRGSRLCLILGLTMAIPLAVFGESFIRLWVRKQEFAWTWTILGVLLLAELFNFGQFTAVHLLTARKNIRPLSLIMALRTALAVVLMVVFMSVTDWGIMGVAIAIAVAMFLFSGIWLPVHTCRQVGINFMRYWRKSHIRPILAGAVLAAICLTVRAMWTPTHLAWAVLELILTGGVGLLLGLFIGVDGEDRNRIKGILRPQKK